jgi:hypothetical protein
LAYPGIKATEAYMKNYYVPRNELQELLLDEERRWHLHPEELRMMINEGIDAPIEELPLVDIYRKEVT